MPPLTISAVDHTTGELTSTAHGLAPGAGPAALFAAPGGVIPAGLAAVTDYWVIVIDANTIKLASSSANAMANIAVTFTGNGTLPLELLLGLPYRRATTYVPTVGGVPGSEVKAADLNSMEDTFIAIWNYLTGQSQSVFGQHGPRTRTLPGCAGPPTTGWGVGSGKLASTGVGNATIALPMEVGDRLLSVSFVCEGDGSVALQADILKQVSAVASDTAVNVSVTLNPVPVGDHPLTVTVTTPAANAGEAMYLNVHASAANLTVAAITYTYDRPGP